MVVASVGNQEVEAFCKKWEGTTIEDAFTVNSSEFLKFASEFRNVIQGMCSRLQAGLDRFTVGHYFVSGFITRDNSAVYFSYSIIRGCPVKLTGYVSVDSILVRTAASINDYRGGTNTFVPMTKLEEHLNVLL